MVFGNSCSAVNETELQNKLHFSILFFLPSNINWLNCILCSYILVASRSKVQLRICNVCAEKDDVCMQKHYARIETTINLS